MKHNKAQGQLFMNLGYIGAPIIIFSPAAGIVLRLITTVILLVALLMNYNLDLKIEKKGGK